MQPVQATKVIKWIENEMPPLTWSVIGIKLVEPLLKQGIRPSTIDENTIFNEIILLEINKLLNELYSKNLPNF